MWKIKTDIFFTFSLEVGAKIKIHAKFFDREKGTKNKKKYEVVVLVLLLQLYKKSCSFVAIAFSSLEAAVPL